MYGVESTVTDESNSNKATSNYTLLASLIIHEQNNLSDQSLYGLLYYYHSFPSFAIDRIMDEIHHDGLMVSVMIKFFLMYDHRGKALTLQEIFEGFNDASVALNGPEMYIKMKRKGKKRNESKNNNGKSRRKKNNPNSRNPNMCMEESSHISGDSIEETCDVTPGEIDTIMGGAGRKRRRIMCNVYKEDGLRVVYECSDKYIWQAVINYYLRPVIMHEDRMVFVNDGYDTFEDDAVESCVAHITTHCKNTKADMMTAFKDARTVWRMHHGSHLIYESDLRSDTIGCYFHFNAALKIYEMFCGGCVTRMRRVHKNYLMDRTRFNISVYDVVAECRTATLHLTSAIDRSYMNLLLRQPVVPPFLENGDVRQLFMSNTEIQKGSFGCLSIMDYIRAMNLFDRSNCTLKNDLETCEYVERFLDNLYTNDIAAEQPPNTMANANMRMLYVFYSLYIYEVLFNMRQAYVRRENCQVSIERMCNELDVRELLVLFFGETSMKRVEGLNEELEDRICQTATGWSNNNLSNNMGLNTFTAEDSSAAGGRFDVRPILAAEIPDKILRMTSLFGQFGFDVMQDNNELPTSNLHDDKTSCDILTETSLDSTCSSECNPDCNWDDECKYEQLFYVNDNWLETVYERISNKKMNGKTSTRTPVLFTAGGTRCGEQMFVRETVRTIMRLELKRHIDNDRLGKLGDALRINTKCKELLPVMGYLPMRLKLLAFILTTHTFKLKTKRLAPDFLQTTYRNADGRFTDELRTYEGEVNADDRSIEPPEKVWCQRTETLLNDRLSLLLHARWLAEKRFDCSFFVGLDPVQVYDVLYEYMENNEDRYPAFQSFKNSSDNKPAALNICTAMMFILIMSGYDQEHVDLYLKVFLAVEWPGQWAKTIFVWKSNSNAGKSYLFDSIIKRACANSTCINDPKGGKENAPEKAEYVKNFVLFANEFSQANSNELKKIVSESTFKFRMNYGNIMHEVYATGKIMFNCNTLPPTSDEAAINRLTLFNMPFWFCRRQRISDALLNWTRSLSMTNCTRWEMAYRYELPTLLTEEEKTFLESHDDTKNEKDLFDGYATVRHNMFATDFNRSTSSLFLVQNKTSRLYVSSSPPTDRIVHGLVNITAHFSWLRYFKRLDMPVDFSTLPASSEAVRSEWLSLTLPYQEWKHLTGARTDPSGRIPVESINKSLQAFATKKNVNYFGLRQFFETDFASSREAITDVYYMWFDSKAICAS